MGERGKGRRGSELEGRVKRLRKEAGVKRW